MEEDLRALAQTIADMVSDARLMVASAESCTGGLIARTLTSIPGASHWFHTGVVSYTYESKHTVLGIESSILDGGLVTAATAEAMARRVAELSGADYAVSTTGVSGPEASEGHEPCFAYIGLYTPDGVCSVPVRNADEGRAENTQWIALQALTMLEDSMRKGRRE